MNETKPNFWKRPWSSPAKRLAWFILLAGAVFAVLCTIMLGEERSAWGPELPLNALVLAVVLVLAASGLLWFICWLCRGRNFRRFSFVVVCLITVVALAYAEENWRGRHAWLTHRQACEAKGEPFALASLIPPPVPDDKNFALTPFLKPAMDFTRGPSGIMWHDTNGLARLEKTSAELSPQRDTNDHLVLGSLEKGTFANLAACAAFYRGNTNYPQAPATATAAETILFALDKFAPELQELRAAAASRPEARWPVAYDEQPCWTILLPHLVRVKGLTLLLNVRAIAELEAGHSAEAFDDLRLGWRFSDSLRREPILIDHLVRAATLAIELQTVREGLVRHAWNEPQLAELETNLAAVDLLAEYKLAMRGERALEVASLDFLRRQGFRNDALPHLASDEGEAVAPWSYTPLPAALPSGWFYQNMLTMSRMFEDFTLPAVDAPAHHVFAEVSEKGERALARLCAGPYTFFAKLMLPAMEKAVRRSARMQTYADATLIACALERYRLANGQLPDTLEALVPRLLARIPNDVIDGKPLRYRRHADGGFVLYSVGWNETDEGGQLVWTKQQKNPSVDVNQGDWVWQMAAR